MLGVRDGLTDASARGHPEIERKFLVRSFTNETDLVDPLLIYEVYVRTEFPVERIRLEEPDYGAGPRRALRTIKRRAASNDWRTQREVEEETPYEDAMLFFERHQDLPHITKMRFVLGRFILDQFSNVLSGLYILEVELSDPDERITIPDGFDVIEVTEDLRFRNENLAQIQTAEELRALIASIGG